MPQLASRSSVARAGGALVLALVGWGLAMDSYPYRFGFWLLLGLVAARPGSDTITEGDPAPKADPTLAGVRP